MARKAVTEAESLNGHAGREETLRILKKVEYEATRGKHNISMTVNTPDYEIVKKRLETLGFGVKLTYDQRDGNYFTISW